MTHAGAVVSRYRSDHDPDRPRLDLSRSPSPRALQFVRDAIRQAESLYWDTRRWAEDLQYVRRSRAQGADPAARRVPCRTRRSERREAWVRLVRALLYRCDLRSLRVGTIHADDSCTGLTYRDLRGIIGTDVSRSRLERALADFHDATLVASKQPRELEGETWRGLPAIRRLSVALFDRLGMRQRLHLERVHAAKRWKEAQRQRREAARGARAPSAIVRSVLERLEAPGQVARPAPAAPAPETPEGRAIGELAAALRAELASRRKKPPD